MTTGRINQVTTFRSAFAAIAYSRATSAHFRDVEFIIPFCVEIHRSSIGDTFPQGVLGLIEPANGITSFPILARPKWDPPFPNGNKGHPPSMRTTNVRWHLKGACTDMADPQVASCIRCDHRQAIHLLQHCPSMPHKDSLRLQRQARQHGPFFQGQSPSS